MGNSGGQGPEEQLAVFDLATEPNIEFRSGFWTDTGVPRPVLQCVGARCAEAGSGELPSSVVCTNRLFHSSILQTWAERHDFSSGRKIQQRPATIEGCSDNCPLWTCYGQFAPQWSPQDFILSCDDATAPERDLLAQTVDKYTLFKAAGTCSLLFSVNARDDAYPREKEEEDQSPQRRRPDPAVPIKAVQPETQPAGETAPQDNDDEEEEDYVSRAAPKKRGSRHGQARAGRFTGPVRERFEFTHPARESEAADATANHARPTAETEPARESGGRADRESSGGAVGGPPWARVAEQNRMQEGLPEKARRRRKSVAAESQKEEEKKKTTGEKKKKKKSTGVVDGQPDAARAGTGFEGGWELGMESGTSQWYRDAAVATISVAVTSAVWLACVHFRGAAASKEGVQQPQQPR